MTPSHSRPALTRARIRCLLAIGLVTCALSACTPATAGRAARSPEERASAKAEETYRAYIDATNELDAADPGTFPPVAALTTPELFDILSAIWAARTVTGRVIRGNVIVDDFRAVEVHPDQRVEATACLDLSGVTAVDHLGAPVGQAGAPELLQVYLEFAPVDDVMLLSDQVEIPLSSCLPTGTRPAPAAPTPAAPVAPESDDPAREDDPAPEQDESCTSYPDGLTICDG